jgi:hypothetical protein
VAGGLAYAQDVPAAEIHILDAGHFALDQKSPEISALVDGFMDRNRTPRACGSNVPE